MDSETNLPKISGVIEGAPAADVDPVSYTHLSRKFGLPASEVMYVRDGYELVRYLMRCAEQCRSRVAAIYPCLLYTSRCV